MSERVIQRNLTDSFIFEIIDIAQNEREILPKEITFERPLSERIIIQAVNSVASADTGIRDRIILDDRLDDSAIAKAAHVAIRRRKSLSFFIKPFRRKLPKLMLRELSYLRFLSQKVCSLSFLWRPIIKCLTR